MPMWRRNGHLYRTVDVKMGWFQSITGDNFSFPSHVQLESFTARRQHLVGIPHMVFAEGYDEHLDKLKQKHLSSDLEALKNLVVW